MRIEQIKQNRRKLERRIDDWKPMRGMDRRTCEDENYSRVEQRIEIGRRLNERRGYIYTLPERRNVSRRRATERRGRVYYGAERRQRDRRFAHDRRERVININN